MASVPAAGPLIQVLVTESGTWTDRDAFWAALDRIAAQTGRRLADWRRARSVPVRDDLGAGRSPQTVRTSTMNTDSR
jgi:hypothetical protein